MSAYQHLLNPTVPKSRPEQTPPWHGIRWFVKPLHFVLVRPWKCWHRRMSRPFTRDGETYRVCLRCGVHRRFDLDAWKTKGSYYYDKKVTRPADSNSSHGAPGQFVFVKGSNGEEALLRKHPLRLISPRSN